MTIPQQPSPVAGRALTGSPPMQPGAPPPLQPGAPPPYVPPPGYAGYAADASGLPMTPPQGVPQGYAQAPYGQPPYPPHPGYPPQPYAQYPGYAPPQPGYAPPQPGYAAPPVTPGALYQLQPQGASPPVPMTLTGQLRLFEADELPDKYKVSGAGTRWIKLAIAAVLAISVAAGVTFFIIRTMRDTAPEVGTIRVDSVPSGGEVTFDGTRMAGSTPLAIESVPVGTRHEVKIELARHKVHTETVDVPKRGGEVSVNAILVPITGKLRIVTEPDGAEIWIDGTLRGRAPTTIGGIEMSSARSLELRLEGYRPYIQKLEWPANGEINIDQKLQR